MANKIIPYNPNLKLLARELRKKRNLSEVIIWKAIKGKALKVEFHRQVPMLNFIVDFYCHELMLVIEVDGGYHQNEEVKAKDALRQSNLEQFGASFIRFSDKEVLNNLQNVLLAIEEKIIELKKKKSW